jgi:carbon-monoxide dehydrogenase small subunit
VELALTVNVRQRVIAVEPRVTLAELLRDRCGLTGLKVSCDMQVCGACTVLVDRLAVSACTY